MGSVTNVSSTQGLADLRGDGYFRHLDRQEKRMRRQLSQVVREITRKEEWCIVLERQNKSLSE